MTKQMLIHLAGTITKAAVATAATGTTYTGYIAAGENTKQIWLQQKLSILH